MPSTNSACIAPETHYTVDMPKTSTDRVRILRAARAAQGLRRLELYVHPEDWPEIKRLAGWLAKRRANRAKV